MRPKRKPKTLDDYVSYTAVTDIIESKNFRETTISAKAKQWWQAMVNEHTSIVKNNTWEKCELPGDQSVIGSKWIYKKKISADGSTRYKARLVAQGFS